MAWSWEELVRLYDKLEAGGKPVCPIAHTYITAHIAVLIDKDGNFLAAMDPEVKGELVAVPCTAESETRTSGAAPHLISDQLQYVAELKGREVLHKEYIKQLVEYVSKNPSDDYAYAVCKYVKNNNIIDDVQEIIKHNKNIPEHKLNIIFGVYGINDTGSDLQWTEYYLNKLQKNGICSVTGIKDYIPSAYPACIMSQSGKEKLFMSGSQVGYIASQKAIHALQYVIYAQKNSERVEAEYNILDYCKGKSGKEDLKKWIDEKYPGKWEKFIKILENPIEDKKESPGE